MQNVVLMNIRHLIIRRSADHIYKKTCSKIKQIYLLNWKLCLNLDKNMVKDIVENLRVFLAIVCIMFIILGMGCLCCSIYCSISTSTEYSSEQHSNSPRIKRARLQTQRRHMGEGQVPSVKSKGSNKRNQSRRISFAQISIHKYALLLNYVSKSK